MHKIKATEGLVMVVEIDREHQSARRDVATTIGKDSDASQECAVES